MDADGGCRSHIQNTERKMRSRTWALSRLKQYGFKEKELVSVYKTYIRPLAEYVSVSWHSCLSSEQAVALEQQQTRALRQIYGFDVSAKRMRELANIEMRSIRREKACMKFAKNALTGVSFNIGSWKGRWRA